LQQTFHRRILVTEQGHAQFIRRVLRHAQAAPVALLRPAIGTERIAPRQQVALQQQAAGLFGEAGKKEILGQRQARMRRRQPVVRLHPVLGRKIFEVQPYRLAFLCRHRSHIRWR
jgi:hypothetical protein